MQGTASSVGAGEVAATRPTSLSPANSLNAAGPGSARRINDCWGARFSDSSKDDGAAAAADQGQLRRVEFGDRFFSLLGKKGLQFAGLGFDDVRFNVDVVHGWLRPFVCL